MARTKGKVLQYLYLCQNFVFPLPPVGQAIELSKSKSCLLGSKKLPKRKDKEKPGEKDIT